MKTKPNTDQFKPKKDPSDFLEGGAADVADRTVKQQKVVESKVQTIESVKSARIHREQKIFRLPLDLINDLKREAYERSVKAGYRVTETELVEQSLRAFLSVE